MRVWGPRDIVDCEKRRARNRGRRHPGEGHDVSVKAGLAGVAAVRCYQGGALAGGEAVGSVVEADELGGTLGS